jgi:hypothetical protein
VSKEETSSTFPAEAGWKENSAMPRLRMMAIAAGSLALTAGAAFAGAQQGNGYQGVSRPPQEPIVTSPEVQAKPSAGVPLVAAPVVNTQVTPQPAYVAPSSSNYSSADVPSSTMPVPAYNPAADPDGDIVHPRPARPGELLEGTTIRVKLMDRLSSRESEKGEAFRGQVAFDVLQDGKVLIPAGSGIEGRVTLASSGHFGGHGSLRLRPEAVILPDGSRFELHAETTGAPDSKTRMGTEGTINPGSRLKKDGIEYGAVVGAGAVTGAVIAGPVGALTGGLIGAGVVTTHLMVDHPQATLEPGSMLLFTLTEPMNLMPQTN